MVRTNGDFKELLQIVAELLDDVGLEPLDFHFDGVLLGPVAAIAAFLAVREPVQTAVTTRLVRDALKVRNVTLQPSAHFILKPLALEAADKLLVFGELLFASHPCRVRGESRARSSHLFRLKSNARAVELEQRIHRKGIDPKRYRPCTPSSQCFRIRFWPRSPAAVSSTARVFSRCGRP